MSGVAAGGGLAGALRAWLLASRPKTLPAAVIPVAVGSAVAARAGAFALAPALGALAVALTVQIGTNFANDVFDYEKGADTEDRLGPTRAVQAGLLSPAQMRRGMWLVFGACAAAGLYLTAVAGWPLLLIGVASILSGLAYTGGPYPLGYHGLGDVFVLVFFGFVAVCGTVYVQALGLVPLAWWAAVPVGCLSTAILVVNNLRDRHTDVVAGKRTLAVRFGRRGAERELLVLLVAAYTAPAVVLALGLASAWALAPWASLPLALGVWRQVKQREGPALNATLGATARLLVVYGVLFVGGLLVGGAWADSELGTNTPVGDNTGKSQLSPEDQSADGATTTIAIVALYLSKNSRTALAAATLASSSSINTAKPRVVTRRRR